MFGTFRGGGPLTPERQKYAAELAAAAGFHSLDAAIAALVDAGDGMPPYTYPRRIREAVLAGRNRPELMTRRDGDALVRSLEFGLVLPADSDRTAL